MGHRIRNLVSLMPSQICELFDSICNLSNFIFRIFYPLIFYTVQCCGPNWVLVIFESMLNFFRILVCGIAVMDYKAVSFHSSVRD